MKKFLNIFFVTLGVIFSILILCALYLFIVDPFNLKPLIFGGGVGATSAVVEGAGKAQDKHPLLSASQEKTLESLGINPANMPSEITPAQEKCFEDALGKERVAEIKNGSSPSIAEFFKAKGCL